MTKSFEDWFRLAYVQDEQGKKKLAFTKFVQALCVNSKHGGDWSNRG